MSGWNTEGTKGRCLIRMNQMTYLDKKNKWNETRPVFGQTEPGRTLRTGSFTKSFECPLQLSVVSDEI